MKIDGHNIHSSVIGQIAHDNGIVHSNDCREANFKSGGFRCRCDFFDKIKSHLPDINWKSADIEAQLLIDQGYYQTSGKYRGVARVKDLEPGNFHLKARNRELIDHKELSPEVFSAFKRLGGNPYWDRKELDRIRRTSPDGVKSAEVVLRVPLPPGMSADETFKKIEEFWPDVEFVSAKPIKERVVRQTIEKLAGEDYLALEKSMKADGWEHDGFEVIEGPPKKFKYRFRKIEESR